MDYKDTVTKMLDGSEVALARLMTLAEKGDPCIPQVKEMISPRLGKAHFVGITGFSGVGKSTLVDGLVSAIRKDGLSVGIVAVDPSSAISGGAVLGDRIRMQKHYLDEKVFIRSVATRGSYGGLSQATLNMANLLDAFGKDIVLIETIGIGQIDVDIRFIADTVVLVMVPETGDTIQFMKGGITEIADIVVVNKANHVGAESMVTQLKNTLSMEKRDDGWQVPVLMTQAIDGTGVEELYREIEKHGKLLTDSGQLSTKRGRE